MVSYFQKLMEGQYAPHGYCLLWQPELIWTHIVSDVLIAGAYFSIPLALIHFVRRRRDLEFSRIFLLFAIFIMACGTTHLMSIWTLWHPDYGAEALVKAFTGIASVGTAIVLWRLIPRALAIPSPAQLRAANEHLAQRIAERDAALEELRHEIDQRQRAEEALLQAQKMEAVGQLTGGIAHDFNNLLQVVTGNLELIARHTDDPARIARYAQSALTASERGTRLTGQLLAFSRTQRLTLEPLDVRALIGGMLDLLRRTLGPAIHIETHLPDTHAVVMADATQLELAILNLAINARDAMPQGGQLVIALTERPPEHDGELAPGRYLNLSITDSGEGMSEDVLRRAFEPFFTTKGVGKGTGLGLSMVYGVARQSGGKAEILSAPGVGTTITIALRTIDRPLEVAILAVSADHDDPVATPATRVMVVDDDGDVRRVMCDMLRDSGHQVVEFANGLAALSALPAVAPGLLIADFAMPGLTGAELAQRARAIMPGLRVLFVSGFADTDAIECAVGPDAAMLRKPFSARALRDAVAAALA